MSESRVVIAKCPKCGHEGFRAAKMIVLESPYQPVGIVCDNPACEHLVTAMWSLETLASIVRAGGKLPG